MYFLPIMTTVIYKQEYSDAKSKDCCRSTLHITHVYSYKWHNYVQSSSKDAFNTSVFVCRLNAMYDEMFWQMQAEHSRLVQRPLETKCCSSCWRHEYCRYRSGMERTAWFNSRCQVNSLSQLWWPKSRFNSFQDLIWPGKDLIWTPVIGSFKEIHDSIQTEKIYVSEITLLTFQSDQH